MDTLQLIFPSMIIIVLALKLYLNKRQANSVKTHFNTVPARFSTSIELNAHQKSGNYTLAKIGLGNIEIILGSLLAIIFTSGGLIQYLDNQISSRLANYPLTQGIALIISLMFISMLCNLPLSLYSTFNIEERFGFNHITIKLFILDTIKSMVLFAVIGIPLLYIVLWLMTIMGSLWWIWVWATFCAFNIILMLAYPTFIAPIFNKFIPLTNEELRIKINNLLKKCGFQSNGIFVMDGSKRSSHGNAYFTGIGKTKRIVFFDTLINKLTPNEIEAILAHELGHFKKKHIIKQIIVSFLISLMTLFVLSLLINQPMFYNALGITIPNNANALILFALGLNVVMFPFSPLSSYLSRKNEFEADDFAKKYSNKDDLISGLIKLYKENSSTLAPDELYAKFYYSHPPASIRIAHLEQTL